MTAPTDQQATCKLNRGHAGWLDCPTHKPTWPTVLSHENSTGSGVGAVAPEIAHLQQTVAELARHNQELSLALTAAERRAKEAEAKVTEFREEIDLLHQFATVTTVGEQKIRDRTAIGTPASLSGTLQLLAEIDRLRIRLEWHEQHRADDALAQWKLMYDGQVSENQILQRTAELQLALVRSTADVVEAARAVRDRLLFKLVHHILWFSENDQSNLSELDDSLTALDQASPREASVPKQATEKPVSPIGPSERASRPRGPLPGKDAMIDHWPDPHAQREAHFQQTIALLEQRLEEQQAETRRLMAIVRRQLPVISAAREASAYYQSVGGPWESLRLSLIALDAEDHQ